MPPQSSLPLRDGRVGLPPPNSSLVNSSSQQNEPYYSEEDFQLLHEVVTRGESILPTLPARDRLPTNALFQAAEQILPAYGYDAEQAPSHISRLIFKIGGHRSGETLSDKFKSVVQGMGIQLEFYPSSPVEQSPAAQSMRSVSVRSFAATDDETGQFDFNPRPPPRRRHSSVSRPTESFLPVDRATQDLPIRPHARARSASVTDYNITDDAPRLDRGVAVDNGAAYARKLSDFAPGASRKGFEEHIEAEHKAAQARNALRRITNLQYDTDEENDEVDEQPQQDVSIRSFQAHVPVMERARYFRRSHSSVPDEEVGDSEVESNKEFGGSPSTVGETDLIPRSLHSDPSGACRRSSDTTVQTQDDKFSAPHDAAATNAESGEAALHQFKMFDDKNLASDALVAWRHHARNARLNNEELDIRAEVFDYEDLVNEVVDIWSEEALAVQHQRLEVEAAAEQREYVERMERRAQRVYEIFTIRNALSCWHYQAREEVERTAVARRHLVRKRAFEAWRAQHVEDELKVKNFIIINALQKWSQVALHHEVREQVAVRWHGQSIAKNALQTMWSEHKRRAADAFKYFQDVDGCLAIWYARTAEALETNNISAKLDERLLLEEAMTIWQEETGDLQEAAYRGELEKFGLDCRNALNYWQEQARLAKLLKQHNALQEDNVKYRVLRGWRSRAHSAYRNKAFADVLFLEDRLEHWNNETKLRGFVARAEEQTQNAVLVQWALEEKLAWCKRRLDTDIQRRALNVFLLASRQARNSRVTSEDEADYVNDYRTQEQCVISWYEETVVVINRHYPNADLVTLYRTTRPLLDIWQPRAAQSHLRRNVHERHATLVANTRAVSSVLRVWPGVAERTRQERMLSALRGFRRNYKLDLVSSCLDTWWFATSGSVNAGFNADNMHVNHKRDDINEYLDYWVSTANRAQGIREIAAEAELEALIAMWHSHLHEMRENMQDAVDYDVEKTWEACWKVWEFQALQLESRQGTVAALQNRNDQHVRRQLFEEWHQKAVPEATYVDPHLSTMERRSMRKQLGPRGSTFIPRPLPPQPFGGSERGTRTTSRRSSVGLETPSAGAASQFGTHHRFGHTPATATLASRYHQPAQLGPMDDFDEESLLPDLETNDPVFMSTPTRWTGSARPLGYRPTTTPSAILPSPYERELRREYGNQSRAGLSTRRVEFADIREDSAEA
ncbi:Sfi1 spindle body protein-domain-containing protein [Podospora didyma]|uniref:Sfi1 spindle body protein-domain-containing protein n=1 Tax=Podospora didyma TaxID=330526 RepID=A0AAE0NTJ3_9PEZI|nr:Sfi1 spindle body protein-domain-containing protein [Podospora didyma]